MKFGGFIYMRCLIHPNGGFDILGEYIHLTDNYPSIDGQPLRPVRVRSLINADDFFLGPERLSSV